MIKILDYIMKFKREKKIMPEIPDFGKLSILPKCENAMEPQLEQIELLKKLKEESAKLLEEFYNGEKYEILLKKYQKLEIKYNVIIQDVSTFITSEELIDFYTVKFYIRTHNIYEQDFLFGKGSNIIELECYKKIVSQKILDVLNGNKPWLQNQLYKTSGVNFVSQILKNKNGRINPLEILKNKTLLSFLLSFDTMDGLLEFYQKTLVDKQNYQDFMNFAIYGCEWEDNLSLYTIYLVRYLSDNADRKMNCDIYDSDPYYHIFKGIIWNHKISGNLPDGVINIFGESPFLKRLNQNIHVLDSYITPLSLKKLQCSLEYSFFRNVKLNEGLKVLSGISTFYRCHIRNLFIPSTLEEISVGVFSQTKIDNVYINNYIQFKDCFQSFDSFIRILFQLEKVEDVDDIDFFGKEVRYNRYRVVPKFSTLSIMENGKVLFTLAKSDFNLIIKTDQDTKLHFNFVRTFDLNINELSVEQVKIYMCSLIEKYLGDTKMNSKQKVKK